MSLDLILVLKAVLSVFPNHPHLSYIHLLQRVVNTDFGIRLGFVPCLEKSLHLDETCFLICTIGVIVIPPSLAMLGMFHEKMPKKGLAQGLAHSKRSVNISCYYTAALDYSHSNSKMDRCQSVHTLRRNHAHHRLPGRSGDRDSTLELRVVTGPSLPLAIFLE